MQTSLLAELNSNIYLILFVVAIVAGVVDAIAGGGGLIAVPGLMLAGLPAMTVLGTNRFQAVIGELTTALSFLLHKQLNLKGLGLGIATTAAGALAGSYCVSLFNKELLEVLLPVLMLAITVYSILSKQLKTSAASPAKLSITQFMLICGPIIGFYNGFFGPGTGSIWMIAFVMLLGHTLKQATMMTKPLNLMGNIISLVFFIHLGSIDYAIGLTMGVGQVLGSLLGSRLVMSQGNRLIRPVFISVTLLMSAKLLYEQLPLNLLA
ncbi:MULTISPECIES: TSUP family transporter [unclassified Agarivorans]|uniref:TSUP family transporter n=1 Tax=unclassified Agarivorans TaxID=2636026 RepID=UPI003D7CA0BE